MKILAIRGKNLASLAGEFTVDFQVQPLASAGLFAISGPTGAGKSTLLDALCLALYDKTPRLKLAGDKGVHLRDVGDEKMPQHDVRSLLRRGCADGFAEVEFIGSDNQHYRSRWSVRRAHGRADRKLQATEMELARLPDGQRIGGKKTEVLNAIVEKLGLSFDQFTRAVLLAQNEFGVFLKAQDDERASLLETLTGTDEYSRVSKRAFERAKLERQKLDDLNRKLELQQPLAEDEREALRLQAQELECAMEAAHRQKVEIEGHLQWHRRYRDLQTAEQDAQVQLQHAQEDHQRAQDRRERLDLVEALQDARPLLSEYEHAREECLQLRQQLVDAETAATGADAQQETARLNLDRAERHLEDIERQQLQIREEIVRARELDAEIGTVLPKHRQQQESLVQARRQQQQLQAQHDEALQNRQRLDQALTDCSSWLDAHADWLRLSEQWPRWDSLFKQGKSLEAQLQAARAAFDRCEKTVRQQHETLQVVRTQLVEAEPRVNEANRQWLNAEDKAGQFDAESLSREHESHQARLARLREADGIWQALSHLTTSRATQNAALQQLQTQRLQQGEALAAIQGQLPALIASHEQAQKMLDLAKLACSENVEKLRARLQPESECPVCGSKQHPFSEQAHPFRDELNALETEVQACFERRKSAERDEGRLSLQIEAIDKQVKDFMTTLDALTADIAEQRKRWDMQTGLGDGLPLDDERIGNWLSEQVADEEQAQQSVAKQLKAMSVALSERESARRSLDAVIKQQQELERRLGQVQSALREAELARSNAEERRQALSNQLEQLLNELDGGFADSSWLDAWRQDVEALHARSTQQVQEWQNRTMQREQLTNQLSVLQGDLSGLRSRIEQVEEHLRQAGEAYAVIDGELNGKLQQRQTLLNGRAVSEVEAESLKAINDAKNALQSALADAQSAATRAATARETVKQIGSMLAKRQGQGDASEQKLAQWLQAFASTGPTLTVDELRGYLQQEAGWLMQERKALAVLDKALAQVQTVINERRQQCEQHLQARTSLESRENLETQLQQISADHAELTRQINERKLQLRIDDERLQQSAALRERIATQSAVHDIWEKLNSLIGSADGKKFRNVAQQLTLDILLGYANRHLKELSRRYRLERVGDTLALQVVDQDMGDEVRSVHSLSGGESFLLSLALALGLASLSSNRVRVESLFIDEGFGSLDSETLRVAMDALDSLQALGRKVGVISHVQEMTERIGTRIEVRRIGSGSSKIVVD